MIKIHHLQYHILLNWLIFMQCAWRNDASSIRSRTQIIIEDFVDYYPIYCLNIVILFNKI